MGSFLRAAAVLFLSACAMPGAAGAQSKPDEPDFSGIVQGKGWVLVNREASWIEVAGKQAVFLNEKPGDGMARLENAVFGQGVLELDLKGRNVLQRSFIGVAFHILDEKTYEAVYFRPFNFKSEDTVRQSHAVQYISHPEFTWQRLRQDRPGQFEKPVNPVPDPEGWFRARIEATGEAVRVYVNGAKQPCPTVQPLGGRKDGGIALWVGNGSNGTFANLKIIPME